MNLKDTYNKIARQWHTDHKSDDWWIAGTNHFVSLLKNGDTLLDAGCGDGTKSKYLTDKGLKVTGIDFSEEMIKIAKEEVPEANFEVVDMLDTHLFNQKCFDAVFMQASLLHIPKKDALKVIENFVKNYLKNDGYFYVAVKEIKPDGPEEEVKTENDYGYDYQRFFSYYSLDEIKNYFKESGLKIVYEEINGAGRIRWIQVIGRKS